MASSPDSSSKDENAYDDHDETMQDQSSGEEEDKNGISARANGTGHHRLDYNTEPPEPTDYSLFSNPPQLATTRQRLFALEEPLEMAATDFHAYFPFVDNVWRKLRASDQNDHNQSIEWYWCRLRKAPGAKVHVPRPTPEGKTARRKRAPVEKTCGMAMKVTYNHGPVQKVIIERGVDTNERHTHDLDFMDGQKRNSAIMDVARREANRAFLPTSVFWKMRTEPVEMEAAGGKSMKISDVRNVQYAWRQENPDVPLKSHTGFNASRTGPKPQPQATSPQMTAQPRQPYEPPAVPPVSSGPAGHPPPSSMPHPQHPHYQPPSTHFAVPESIHYPLSARDFLRNYVPNPQRIAARNRPHVTLTWASSLDGRIAISPGHRTTLSGPETKAMTHYLRSCHDAILVGVRTAIADDPSLNCRLEGAGGYGGPDFHQQPRPIIIDPSGRLHIRPEMKILQAVEQRSAKAPWIVVGPHAQLHPTAVSILKAHGGEYLMINDFGGHKDGFDWEGVFNVLFRENIRSIMVEGGGVVLSELVKPKYSHIIDSVVMTLAPIFLGKQGVQVSQDPQSDERGHLLPTGLTEVLWQPMGESDVVMCGKPTVRQPIPQHNGILQGIEDVARETPSQYQQKLQPPPPR